MPKKNARQLTQMVDTSEWPAFWGPVYQGPRSLGPPYFINYKTITLRLIRHTTSLFLEFETSPPPLKLTFCTEFALF